MGLVAAVALTALAISTWVLLTRPAARPSGSPGRAAGAGATTVVLRPTSTAPLSASKKRPARATPPAQRGRVTAARLVLTATGGTCWLEVRAGSPRALLLYRGTLEQGRSVRFVRQRLWVGFGAGGNLEVSLNGRRVERFPTGTASVLVTAKGVGTPRAL